MSAGWLRGLWPWPIRGQSTSNKIDLGRARRSRRWRPPRTRRASRRPETTAKGDSRTRAAALLLLSPQTRALPVQSFAQLDFAERRSITVMFCDPLVDRNCSLFDVEDWRTCQQLS